MPSRMRHGLLISVAVISLFMTSVFTSYADTTNYVYDELNRLIRVEYGDGTKTVYIYDQVGNRSQVYAGEYTLGVNVVGDGTVTKNPDQPIYSAGTSVTLAAINGFQTFSEWSGGLTGNTNPTTLVMDGNKSVTATFTGVGGLQGWTYRKPVTLSRASGAVTNYQMKLLVGESSGTVGFDVHCNGHVRADFNDLRFTTADGTTLLDYWIESITGTTPNRLTTVWVEFDSIGTSATTFYMYYGKSDAPAVSNGANTFIVFDNFERGSNGDAVGGIWTGGLGTVEISTTHAYSGTRSARLKGAATVPQASFTHTTDANKAIRLRLYKQNAADYLTYVYHGGSGKRGIIRCQTNEKVTVFNGTSYVDTGATIAPDTWQLLEYNDWNWTNKTVDVWVNGSKAANDFSINAAGSAGIDRIIISGVAVAGNDSWVDNFIVRNWRATEPAWGSWGAEQAN